MNDQVQNLIQIRKSLARGKAGKLAQNKAFLDFIAYEQKVLAELAEINSTWNTIKEKMNEHDIQRIEKIPGYKGFIGFVPYPTYKADGKVAPRFTKQTLDGAEIRHYMKNHSGQAPKGVKVATSMRFRKDIKLGA